MELADASLLREKQQQQVAEQGLQQLQQQGQEGGGDCSGGGGSREGCAHAWLAEVELPCALLQQLEVQLSQKREQLLELLINRRRKDGGSGEGRGVGGTDMAGAEPKRATAPAPARVQGEDQMWSDAANLVVVSELAQQGVGLHKQPWQLQQHKEEQQAKQHGKLLDARGNHEPEVAQEWAKAATTTKAVAVHPVAAVHAAAATVPPGQLLDCCEAMSTAAVEMLKHIVPHNLAARTSPSLRSKSITQREQVQRQQQDSTSAQTALGGLRSQQLEGPVHGAGTEQCEHWLSSCWLHQIRAGAVASYSGLGSMKFSMKLLAAVTSCDKYVKVDAAVMQQHHQEECWAAPGVCKRSRSRSGSV
jgi:hypothetical protein